MPGVTVTVPAVTAGLPAIARPPVLPGEHGAVQGCGTGYSRWQPGFHDFTAMSKKMRFCSGSAAFRATHPKFLFHLEIACVQDGISFISDSLS